LGITSQTSDIFFSSPCFRLPFIYYRYIAPLEDVFKVTSPRLNYKLLSHACYANMKFSCPDILVFNNFILQLCDL
jgi:hypothetical protein